MGDDTAVPLETELKLALTEEAAQRLRAHALFRPPPGAEPEQRRLVSTYFDTEDRAFAGQGLALRVRSGDGRFLQTLKSAGEGGVAFSRGEWEWEIGGETPDLSRLSGTPASALPLPDLAARVKPLFRTDVTRTIRILTLDQGTTAEAALDAGRVVAGDAEEPVLELELELRAGRPGPLYRLALELHAESPIGIATESKAERGYRLATREEPRTLKAPEIRLAPGLTAAEGFHRIAESLLGHFLINEPAALVGAVEGIHQMRVAIRRLRAHLVLFAPYLEPHARGRFENELQRMGRVFGEARDWDVFCTEILPNIQETVHASSWLQLLHAPAELRRQSAHGEFRRECAAPTFAALVLGFAGWAADGAAMPELLGSEALRQPLAELAPGLLDTLDQKVQRRGRHIGEATDTELHALRKSLKKLRYGVEFLGSLFPDEERQHFQHRCEALQGTLGAVQDAAMAVALAETLAEGLRVDLAPAIALLAQGAGLRRRDALRDLNDDWQDFLAEPRFWK
jgi:triphosphatase